VSMDVRVATMADVPALNVMIAESARGLSAGYYTPEQIEAMVTHVFGVDTQLVADRTYYIVVGPNGEPAACGGWSARRALYGGDQMRAHQEPDARLDPATEPARIRAFFVHPAYARRGLGRRLYAACASAAHAAGFRGLELLATLPGEPLYRALGFTEIERIDATLPNGVVVPVVRMSLALAPAHDR
jgi:GNAT superfamily N-acetyltransferase